MRRFGLAVASGFLALTSSGVSAAPPSVADERCSKDQVRSQVLDFVQAYNSGNFRRLDSIFAVEPDFLGYYAAPERTYEAGEDRSTLVDYFRERHELEERLNLEVFWIQKERESDGSFDFYFELTRKSKEVAARGYYSGKGNARHTDEGCQLRLWNMTPTTSGSSSQTGDPRVECDAADVRAMVRIFVGAYNAGKVKRLDSMFLKEERFQSYDVHPIERRNGDDRSTLTDYFKERHAYNDSIDSIERLRAGRYDNGNRGFGFSLEFDRSSEELSPFANGQFAVKGSATCGGLYFWNMNWIGP